MKNWHDEQVTISNECPWEEDSKDALLVAEKLNIPFHAVDCSQEYKERIVDYMFKEYESGRTPNPDVLCNREIKFDVFLKIALQLGADYVATGHYCRKSEVEIDGKQYFNLLAGVDNTKDQSYFLCQLNQTQLSKALFPIGELQKKEVRKIAEEVGLHTAGKKDSQGLCFIGKVRLPEFLQQQLSPKEGEVYEIPSDNGYYQHGKDSLQELAEPFVYQPEDGILKGKHPGAHFFTIGQRKGLNIGGSPKPLFVINTDVEKNRIYVGQGDDHPGLFKKVIFISQADTHWVRPDMKLQPEETENYDVRIRYRQELKPAKIHQTKQGIYIEFDEPIRAVAPGQFAAWYKSDVLIGSGIIN
jgi:tRNA-specific 2-thiouridylase